MTSEGPSLDRLAGDRQRLATFLSEAEDVIGEIVGRLDDLAPTLASLRGEETSPNRRAARAWASFLAINQGMRPAIGFLREADPERPERPDVVDAQIVQHGLFGAQLDFKLQLFRDARERYHREMSRFDQQAPWHQRVVGRLARLFRPGLPREEVTR